MQTLAPCPGCARHLRVDAPRCPFCDAPTVGLTPLGFDADAAPPRVRFAALALGATLTLTGCPTAAVYGGPPVPPQPIRVDAGEAFAPTPAYGLPPSPELPPEARRPPPAPAPGLEGTVVPAYGVPPRP